MKNVFLTSLAAFALGSGGVLADGKINVITSFPDSMTSPIELHLKQQILSMIWKLSTKRPLLGSNIFKKFRVTILLIFFGHRPQMLLRSLNLMICWLV